ncbi:hypothetical protein BD324DRAFT_647866 [Kockovaella imperatae]|uniref:WD40-repeat-containing domain protein n=1 Tax=Kockovaella imperatae TaxID=4999 RepID=A0A1Y1USG9_9TREE|nr:hypothetical protein BD324DRAFT_647866 [Kockovaella imperatae]ORX40963.1 hypothetical protein BD324DRAFT_647866 [Kockovaella imperatae]
MGRLLPSPTKSSEASRIAESTDTLWQEADLGDGRGRRSLLMIYSSRCALRIFSAPTSVLPDDPHVQEISYPPEEVFNLPRIIYTGECKRMNVGTIRQSLQAADANEHVVSSVLLVDGPLWEAHGPVAALCVVARSRKAISVVGLVIVSLKTGIALYRVELGIGNAASVTASSRAIVVALSHPSPTLHILDPSSLEPLQPPIRDLPSHHRTSLPVFSLIGRLLAYTTHTPPLNPGPDGLGSIITARPPPRPRPSTSDGSLDLKASSQAQSSQSALLASAVEIGGGVAKGVWAGIKYGARAAQQARAGKLGSSAPAEASDLLDRQGDEEASAVRSDLGSADGSEDVLVSSQSKPGVWVKIVDLCPRTASTDSSKPLLNPLSRKSPPSLDLSATVELSRGPETLAYFKLPPSKSLATSPARIRSSTSQPISFLTFSPSGSHVLVSPQDGRSAHLFEFHPLGPTKHRIRSETKGCVWHTHELRRGNTSADICYARWDRTERWIGLGTSRGTIHLYPVRADGPADASSHALLQPQDLDQPPALHTLVASAARLHPSTLSHESEGRDVFNPGVFHYTLLRKHDLSSTSTLYQDIVIVRPLANTVELSRIVITKRTVAETPRSQPMMKRASGLTEMMRSAYWSPATDLGVKSRPVSFWSLPPGDERILPHLLSGKAKVSRPKLVPPVSSLARAEIQTHTMCPRIVPKSVYLSHQMEFFSARAIDDFSPLSIMDPEAKTRRLVFRHEVEAQRVLSNKDAPEVDSFDEPLLTALRSIMDSPPDTQLPRLPNGDRAKLNWQSATIPIRHVAVGLGEGVDRVRREYARAQHIRQKRRASQVAEAAANKLSFEEDVVLPPSGPNLSDSALEEDVLFSPDRPGSALDKSDLGSGSLPSSEPPPSQTNTDSSHETPLEGWGEEWEEEYAKAVEDDGAPEELVLGLMDEEQEERKKWLKRREDMKREWSKGA